MILGINNISNIQLSEPIKPSLKIQSTKTEQPVSDKFEKENTISNKAKIGIGIGLSTVLLTIIYFLINRRLPKKSSIKPDIPKDTGIETIIEKPIKPDIVKDNNSNINPLKKQFDDCQIQLNAFKDYNLMSEKEKNQYHNWFKNVYHPILEKIKNNNISAVDGMIFPNNASAQDKEIFWNTLFERAAFNKASFDDALNIFEKFGKRDFSHDTGMNTLSSLAIAFPDYPDNKTSLKVFDLFEKLAVYTPDDTGDGLSFIDILQKPGVLNSENMIKIAFEKGKNFLWDVDSISALEYELIRKKDAPFAQNPKVQELFDACKINANNLKNSFHSN